MKPWDIAMITTSTKVLGKGELFDIAPVACMQQAEKLKTFKKSNKAEPWSVYRPELQLLFKVAFISICHQINWDYLQKKIFEKILENNEDPLTSIRSITTSTIKSWLNDYEKKDRIRATERARLIRNVADVIDKEFEGNPDLFFKILSQSRIKNGSFGKVMSLFDAYKKDPLQKKTNVLSHEICSEGIFKIIDEHNMEPAVDYHIIRIYLRTGRVIPKDKSLFMYFKGAPNPRNYIVDQLRKKVSEAIKLTAHFAGLNIAEMNFIEWQLGRSVCTNLAPACQNNQTINIDPSMESLITNRCPYIDSCTAVHNLKELIEFEEPVFITSHY